MIQPVKLEAACKAFIQALIFGFSVGFLASELRAGNEVRVGS